MSVQEKYAPLIALAHQLGVQQLSLAEKEGVLHVSGVANSTADYDALWASYNTIDPDMTSGDLLMNIDIKADAGSSLRVTTDSSNLNIRKEPNTEAEIVGKAAHDEVITLIEKTSDSWWKVVTKDGEEGYAFAQYLSPL